MSLESHSELTPLLSPSSIARIKRISLQYTDAAGIDLVLSTLWLPGNSPLDIHAIEKIISFQRENKLKGDGIIGTETFSAIREQTRRAKEERKKKVLSPQPVAQERAGDLETIRSTIPPLWRSILDLFTAKMSPLDIEKLKNGTPCILIDSVRKVGIIFTTKNLEMIREFPVILGKWGLEKVSHRSSMAALRGSGKTATGIIYRFTDTKIPENSFANASLSGKARWVIGACLISEEWALGWGRWFHGVPEGDTATEGCIGMPIAQARLAAQLVRESGGGFGYVA